MTDRAHPSLPELGTPTLIEAALSEPCPRCHQKCPWCSDYRWMHGRRLFPGTIRPLCTVTYMNDDDECSVCRGSRKVLVRREYRPAINCISKGDA